MVEIMLAVQLRRGSIVCRQVLATNGAQAAAVADTRLCVVEGCYREGGDGRLARRSVTLSYARNTQQTIAIAVMRSGGTWCCNLSELHMMAHVCKGLIEELPNYDKSWEEDIVSKRREYTQTSIGRARRHCLCRVCAN